MKEETHSLKCVYKGVQPFIKVTAYELSAVNCSADKMSGYYGEEGVLISDDPAPGYNFKDWSVTGTTLTGNNFKFNGDVTAQANYSAIKYNVTLQNDGHLVCTTVNGRQFVCGHLDIRLHALVDALQGMGFFFHFFSINLDLIH